MTSAVQAEHTDTGPDWPARARELGEQFRRRAADYDRDDAFVAENYNALRENRLFSIAVPVELGGGGADYSTVCAVVRELGRHCGSTSLAYAMHSHPVALNVLKYKRGDEKAAKTLEKIVGGELVIAGTGANDGLNSGGDAEKVDGGYRVTAHKRFVSGCPGAQVFVTSAATQTPDGPEVLHFSIPFKSEGVEILDTWRTLGMRGTGSHDVTLTNVFVPDEAIVARRPAGVWHPLWDNIVPVALPIIVASYIGQAQEATALALESARGKGAAAAPLTGQMQNNLAAAVLAYEDMVRINNNYGYTPGPENTSAVLARKTLATNAVKATVEKAADIIGGAGFFRGHPIERILRDTRAMHFHPMPENEQQMFTGRVALGLDPVTQS